MSLFVMKLTELLHEYKSLIEQMRDEMWYIIVF